MVYSQPTIDNLRILMREIITIRTQWRRWEPYLKCFVGTKPNKNLGVDPVKDPREGFRSLTVLTAHSGMNPRTHAAPLDSPPLLKRFRPLRCGKKRKQFPSIFSFV